MVGGCQGLYEKAWYEHGAIRVVHGPIGQKIADMKFIVCVKQVPDVTSPLRLQEGRIDTSAGRMVLNAYDASAAEGTIAFTEKYGGEVHAVSIGPPEAQETLRKVLAMGAASAVHIQVKDRAAPPDAVPDILPGAQACARLLADHFSKETFDVIACGKQAQDTDAGLTPAMLAELLGLPFIGNAIALDRDGDGRSEKGLLVTRQGDANQEIMRIETPCVVSCSNNMCDPRIPNIKGIMGARKKPIDVKIVSPPAGNPGVQVQRYDAMPGRPEVRMLEEGWDEAIEALVPFVKGGLSAA